MSERTVCESILIDQADAAKSAARDPDGFAERMLQERRAIDPIVSVEEMRMKLEKEVVLYALDCLKEQGVIGSSMYENAVKIALKC